MSTSFVSLQLNLIRLNTNQGNSCFLPANKQQQNYSKKLKMMSKKFFSRVDWTRIRLVLLCTILIGLDTSKSTSAASSAASAASSGARPGSSAATAASASASASSGILNARLPRPHQLIQHAHARSLPSEVDTLLAQVSQLESKPSNSLEECARWFSLNLRLAELTGRSASSVQRAGELRKKEECDNLQRVLDNRNRLAAFERALLSQQTQLEPVGQLLAEYSALREAANSDEQLARELDSLASTIQPAFGQLEQHTQLMGELFGRAVSDLVVGASGQLDHLGSLDSSIRALIDEESVLDDAQLSRLAEQADELERALADGQLDFYLGRFRYLSGTLDAARTVLLHKMMAPSEGSVVQANEYENDAINEVQAASFGVSAASEAALHRHHNPIFSHSPVSSTSTAAATAGIMPAVNAAHRLAHFRQRRSAA